MKNSEKKEYLNNLNQHIYYSGVDYLTPGELKELQKDVKNRDGALLKNCNGRATIRINKNRDIILTSYYTDVAIISGGRFYKTWRGYSATTLKHINEFCSLYGFKTFSKYEWINTPMNTAIEK